MENIDWEMIEGALELLKPFYEVTVEIKAEKNVTLSKVAVLKIILKFLPKYSSKNYKLIALHSSL